MSGTSSTRPTTLPREPGLRVAALFAGIGGIEAGLHQAGHSTSLLCEIEPAAQAVLRRHFPEVPLESDIRDLRRLPEVDLLTAGFPCQDLSQAGMTRGIGGQRSGLVDCVFQLLRNSNPRWVLLENVPFMLQLDRGRAMWHLTEQLAGLGYQWAYRVVDARSFGLPQRRQRVLMLASRTEDPTRVLFADEAGDPAEPARDGRACGFYWTEGLRGLGWAVDAVPTLKGGSTIGIPSAPAVWMANGLIGTLDLRDAERLQGFPADWTATNDDRARTRGARWKMIGNAVSVPVARWIGERLQTPGTPLAEGSRRLRPGDAWPRAATGAGEEAWAVQLSSWARHEPFQHLAEFLEYPVAPLSLRAAEGFLGRAERGTLRFPNGLLDAVRAHIRSMRATAA